MKRRLRLRISAMENTLLELGVRPDDLLEAEKAALDERGFIVIPGLLGQGQIQALCHRFEELVEAEGDKAGLEVHQQPGTRRLADLVNKGEIFDQVWTHPKVLAAVHHVLKRPFKLSSLNARDALPGQGEQAFHADWGPRVLGDPFHVVNSIWLLDDFTPDNGATRVVPGSHLRAGGPPALKDLLERHPEEALILAPAGTVAVYNAHLWHGGTRNRTTFPRRALHSYYCAREHPPQTDHAKYIRPETLARFNPSARFLLGL